MRRPSILNRHLPLALVLALAPIHPALASNTGGTGMPWENAIQIFVDSVTGPLGGAIALLALAVAGIRWIKSGHGEGADWLMRAALGVTLIVAGTTVLGIMGLTGALL